MTYRHAEFVRDLSGSEEWRGSAHLWKLSRPVRYPRFLMDDESPQSTEYVVTSAVHAMFTGNETYAFPADENGKVLDWGELRGSERGTMDHQRVIDAVCREAP